MENIRKIVIIDGTYENWMYLQVFEFKKEYFFSKRDWILVGGIQHHVEAENKENLFAFIIDSYISENPEIEIVNNTDYIFKTKLWKK